ncbi:MAG: hypothetical protein AUI47_09795 [Acidobacteria bacterium 13_1_40CM_2_68_5]|nr:MAG: hypothetical protein AUI47_09795 [Acidobacteria bacterium 13_1_40CM_2_68_5]
MARRRDPASHPLLLGGLVLVFVLQAFTESRLKTPVFDEPAHIGAGLSYFATREFRVNMQHPPLLKEIGALPLVLIGTRFPISQRDWAAIGDQPSPFLQWQLGHDVIFGNDPDRVMTWSRMPFILMSILLGALLVAWGRRLLGATAATGALLLYLFDPTIVAHGFLVATDVGFAAFAVLFFFALWHYLNHRSAKRLLLCGGALGLVLASKFSAVFLLPVAGLLLIGGTRWIPAAVPMRPSTLVDPYASENGGQRLVWCVYALLAMGAVAALVIWSTYFFARDPFLYIKGMRLINADHDPSYWAYMGGRFKPRFLTYYLVAYLLKEPLPAIILAVVGSWALFRKGASATMDRAFLLLPPACLFLVYSFYSHNLGFRYMIPALPFLHLTGGAGLAFLLKEGGFARRAAATVLCLWTVLAGTAIYPDHLSYFNETACLLTDPGKIGLDGGTACGPLWLDDSNVDWGQAMKQLQTWLRAHPPRQTLRLGYFGSIRPENFGIEAISVGVDDLQRPPSPGTYALSAHIVARATGLLRQQYGDGPGNWLLHARPAAIVGHAYYIYEIPEARVGEDRAGPGGIAQ